ncbi:hypothetical protein JCM5353_000711 [Sporobolomyces roseus]
MPTLEKTERVSSFHQKLTFTIADLNLLDPNLKFSAAINDGILKGIWRLIIGCDTNEGAQELNFTLNHSQISTGALGKDIIVSFKFSCIAEDQTLILIENLAWTHTPELPNPKYTTGFTACVRLEDLQAMAIRSGGVYEPDTHRRYSVEFGLRSVTSMEPEHLAISQSRLRLSPLPNNIRFYLSHSIRSFEIWASLESLPGDLQDSIGEADFVAPARTGHSTRNAPPSMPAATLDYTPYGAYPDSDSEGDSIYSRNLPAASKQANNLPTPNTFRQVNLKGIRYSTFKALLVYLDTGYIEFSPLSSSFPLTAPPFATRRAYLEKRLNVHPNLPLPVSPKSTYRLATLLDVPSLKILSLSSLKSSLTLSNAASELFSPLSISHEEVQSAIIEYVASNWPAIREGESYKEIVKRIKRDEIKGAGKVLVDLIVAVQGK